MNTEHTPLTHWQNVTPSTLNFPINFILIFNKKKKRKASFSVLQSVSAVAKKSGVRTAGKP